jgi:parallel beta-helix repeat protein
MNRAIEDFSVNFKSGSVQLHLLLRWKGLFKKLVSGMLSVLVLTGLLTLTLSLAFNIRSAKGTWTGTVYIRADGSIDPTGAPMITQDKVTYTLTDNIRSSCGIVVERDNIIMDGDGHAIKGELAYPYVGIDIIGRTNITIKNVDIELCRSYGISITNSINISIYGNNITNNNGCGINLEYSSNTIISGNNITNNHCGINLEYSSNTIISGNNITNNNGCGIYLGFDSSNNTISRNNITNNNEAGVWLFYGETTNNIVSGNSITANGRFGVYLGGCSNNIICGNNIIANNEAGVDFEYSSNNTISGNNITNNQAGIGLIGSSNNTFYHNNFIDNTVQVGWSLMMRGRNTWDDGYPSGGNYWSDYAGVDIKRGLAQDIPGSDGIGDFPFTIDADNRDRYPLMYPYGASPPPMYALTITTTVDGTTDPLPGTYSYTINSTVQVTAIPNVGYSFDYWFLNGKVRAENPIMVIMDSNHTLEAYFVDNIRPEMSEPWQEPLPDNVQPFQNVTVWVNVTDYGTGIKNVTLWYSINNGTTWTPKNMTQIATNTFQATIPGYEYSTWVTYKIIAYDNAGNNATKDNNGYGYKYHVIPEFPSTPILMLLMLTTLITTTLWKTKRKRQPP